MLLMRLGVLVLIFCSSFANAQPFGKADAFWADAKADDTRVIDHTHWQRFLDSHVVGEGEPEQTYVAYQRVNAQDTADLRQYLASLQAIAVRSYSRNEQLAFWINLYNAKTVELVLAHYPVGSIRDISFGWFSRGPWKEKLLTVEGKSLSLDDIEHTILRPHWRDSRIHYAVNCASLGCPNLARQAFTGANAEALLQSAAIAYVNHPRGVTINGNDAILSSIYDWYADDFGTDFATLKKHLSQFARPALAAKLETLQDADYEYDWQLNEAR